MRLAFRLFYIPVALVVAAWFLGGLANKFSATTYLTAAAEYVGTAGKLLLLAAICNLAYNGFRIWRAYSGNDSNACDRCCMPTTYKHGRYGPYFKCWRCGANRADCY